MVHCFKWTAFQSPCTRMAAELTPLRMLGMEAWSQFELQVLGRKPTVPWKNCGSDPRLPNGPSRISVKISLHFVLLRIVPRWGSKLGRFCWKHSKSQVLYSATCIKEHQSSLSKVCWILKFIFISICILNHFADFYPKY